MNGLVDTMGNRKTLTRFGHRQKSKTVLLIRRAELSVLAYTLEHQPDMQPSQWQLLSLKRQLREIEKKCRVRKGEKQHGEIGR